MAACDWWGMSSEDVPAIVAMTSDFLSDFAIIPERLSQGVLNALMLMRIMKVDFANYNDVFLGYFISVFG